ncbi:acyltransferase [Pedobacter sp. AW31-3R]|uniref:acyltransferase n=1 Tax=Pedobacter sp. AW31-3R TaxID=3445781 RepID=UPI003FA10FC9
MHKYLILRSYLWNIIMLKLINAKYLKLPKITGCIKVKGLRGKITFGNKVSIVSSKWANPVGLSSDTYICLNPGAEIIIGNNVGISNALLFAWSKITIEDDVRIGGGCQLLDNDFHSLDYTIRTGRLDQKFVKSSPIVIKKGAFIGTQSIILKGVEIGEQSIVAAGSVVAKSIPPFEIWGGNPARFIKKIINEVNGN